MSKSNPWFEILGKKALRWHLETLENQIGSIFKMNTKKKVSNSKKKISVAFSEYLNFISTLKIQKYGTFVILLPLEWNLNILGVICCYFEQHQPVRAFYLLCRKLKNPSPTICYSHSLNFMYLLVNKQLNSLLKTTHNCGRN